MANLGYQANYATQSPTPLTATLRCEMAAVELTDRMGLWYRWALAISLLRNAILKSVALHDREKARTGLGWGGAV